MSTKYITSMWHHDVQNKDISSMPAIKWNLRHEATDLGAYLKNSLRKHTEQLKWLDLAYWHIESTLIQEHHLMQLLAVIVTVLI
jgi:hypothetical protein